MSGDIEIAEPAGARAHPARLRILKAARVIIGELSGPRICHALDPAALEPMGDVMSALAPPSDCCVPDRKELS